MCTKEEVKEVVGAAIAPICGEIRHINSTMSDIKAHIEKLPCGDLSNRIGQLEAEFKFRVETYEREAERRESDIQGAFNLARGLKENPPLKDEVEKLKEQVDKSKDKWENRLYALLLLAFTLYLKYGA